MSDFRQNIDQNLYSCDVGSVPNIKESYVAQSFSLSFLWTIGMLVQC